MNTYCGQFLGMDLSMYKNTIAYLRLAGMSQMPDIVGLDILRLGVRVMSF